MIQLVLVASFIAIGLLSPSASHAATQKLLMVTGGSGGTFYALGSVIANTLNKRLQGIEISCVSSGASIENINLLNANEADFGLANAGAAGNAWNGRPPFKTKSQNYRAIAVVYFDVVQFAVTKKSGIKTFADMKGKRVGTGPAGSGAAVVFQELAGVLGMNYPKDFKIDACSFAEIATKMQDGLLDAGTNFSAVPSATILELSSTTDIDCISISDQELAALQKVSPYYSRVTVPAGTYKNIGKFETFGTPAILFCKTSLSDDLVYKVCKEYFAAAPEIAAGHQAGKDISLKNALAGITTLLHPGAVRFYKENNIKIPADIIPQQ